MTTEQAESSGEVVTGIISVHSRPAYALFDSGASRCFISSAFISAHAIPCVTLERHWTISTGNGSVSCHLEDKGCPIVISDRSFSADMLVISDCEFDVILGMDWLSSCHAIINCRRKTVVFRILNTPEFEFLGNLNPTE